VPLTVPWQLRPDEQARQLATRRSEPHEGLGDSIGQGHKIESPASPGRRQPILGSIDVEDVRVETLWQPRPQLLGFVDRRARLPAQPGRDLVVVVDPADILGWAGAVAVDEPHPCLGVGVAVRDRPHGVAWRDGVGVVTTGDEPHDVAPPVAEVVFVADLVTVGAQHFEEPDLRLQQSLLALGDIGLGEQPRRQWVVDSALDEGMQVVVLPPHGRDDDLVDQVHGDPAGNHDFAGDPGRGVDEIDVEPHPVVGPLHHSTRVPVAVVVGVDGRVVSR
jgi:hypothetical protein